MDSVTDNRNESCSVCLGSLVSGTTVTDCNHIFHQECLVEWIFINPSCPMCRHAFPNCENKLVNIATAPTSRIAQIRAQVEADARLLFNNQADVEFEYRNDEALPDQSNWIIRAQGAGWLPLTWIQQLSLGNAETLEALNAIRCHNAKVVIRTYGGRLPHRLLLCKHCRSLVFSAAWQRNHHDRTFH